MKHSGRKYPSNYVRAASDINLTDEQIREFILKVVRYGIEQSFGFIEGDNFAFAQDEIMKYGNIVDCIKEFKSLVNDYIYPVDLTDEDDINDIAYDSIPYMTEYSQCVRYFRKFGHLDLLLDNWED